MWKSFCLAIGIFSCLMGIEFLLVDSAVISSIDGKAPPRMISAPDWVPWTLISVGAVTILHFSNLQKKAPPLPTKMPAAGHW
ncbi:MAG: hypothetical protein ACKO4Z_13675 [Planctomycetota bacterium]|nr:hypothetical protein [Planctomycetota bacterium]